MLWLIAAVGTLILLWLPADFISERAPFVALLGPTLTAVLVFAAVLLSPCDIRRGSWSRRGSYA